MRRGPNPLPVHIAMAMTHFTRTSGAETGLPGSGTEPDLVQMVRGIQLYQAHAYKPRRGTLSSIWENGTVRLLGLKADKNKRPKNATGVPLLLIPSLVNSFQIMDLMAHRSLLRWFSARGIECYLLDWGNFVKSKQLDIDIDTLLNEKLAEAILFLSKRAGMPIDCLGYCMGGTMLLGAYGAISEQIRRMILLATPWNFHEPKMMLTQHVRLGAPLMRPEIAQRGYLPADRIQTLFASLDAEGAIKKFADFAALDQESEKAKLFVAVEDWLNNGIDLPGKLAEHIIQDWFSANLPYKGKWSVGGRYVDMRKVNKPVLIVASHRDRLVPFEAAICLQQQMISAQVDVLSLRCGHIGFIASERSISSIWTPMEDWLKRSWPLFET